MIDVDEADLAKSLTARLLKTVANHSENLAERLEELRRNAVAEEWKHHQALKEARLEADEARELDERIEFERWKAVVEMMERKRKVAP